MQGNSTERSEMSMNNDGAGDTFRFTGFHQPEANFSRLPHQLTDELLWALGGGETKVLIYLLRHTWGYSEFDKPKPITLDEFENGRRRKDGTRMDRGCGLKVAAVRRALKTLVSRGVIYRERDESDKGRIEDAYALTMASVIQVDQNDQGSDPKDRGADQNESPEDSKRSPVQRKKLWLETFGKKLRERKVVVARARALKAQSTATSNQPVSIQPIVDDSVQPTITTPDAAQNSAKRGVGGKSAMTTWIDRTAPGFDEYAGDSAAHPTAAQMRGSGIKRGTTYDRAVIAELQGHPLWVAFAAVMTTKGKIAAIAPGEIASTDHTIEALSEMGATVEMVTKVTETQLTKPRNGGYQFKYLEKDVRDHLNSSNAPSDRQSDTRANRPALETIEDCYAVLENPLLLQYRHEAEMRLAELEGAIDAPMVCPDDYWTPRRIIKASARAQIDGAPPERTETVEEYLKRRETDWEYARGDAYARVPRPVWLDADPTPSATEQRTLRFMQSQQAFQYGKGAVSGYEAAAAAFADSALVQVRENAVVIVVRDDRSRDALMLCERAIKHVLESGEVQSPPFMLSVFTLAEWQSGREQRETLAEMGALT